MADDETSKDGVESGTDDEGSKDADDQKVTIGDVEMTADEAKALVESGKSFKELQEQYPDIDFKELPKGFTKATQELAELKKPKAPDKPLEPDEEKRIKQIDDFFADPHVQKRLKEIQKQQETQLKEDLELQKVMENLEAEFDGSDGRPKFDRKAVLVYGTQNQIFNPRAAYKEMYAKELEEWAIKQANEKKRPTTFVEKKGGLGSKQPDAKTPTNFREATEAALAEEE